MVKNVLIITSNSEKTVAWQERERYVQAFCAELEAALEKVKVRYATYDDLQFVVRGGTASIVDTHNDLDLKNMAFVHFKNWMYETEEAPVAAAYLRAHNVVFYNSEVHMPIASGKLSQMFRLGAQGIPVPDTFYARRRRLSKIFSEQRLPEGFTFPLIIKATDGSKGDDNHLVRTHKEALAILQQADPEKQFVLQNFVANDGDYRFLFIGLGDEPLVFLRTAQAGSHLNNTSKGGAGAFVNPKTLPTEYLQYARRAAEILQREIGGVDIIVDKQSGKPYVLEVNGTPAIATGYGVDVKVARFAKFLKTALEQQEEE